MREPNDPILLGLVLIISFGFVSALFMVFAGRVGAKWERLKKAECLDYGSYNSEICVVWDELEQTNCYIFQSGGRSAISCIKK